MKIEEFLNARIDEDEAAAGAAAGSSWVTVIIDRSTSEHIVLHDPARVLREVAAKRAIIEAADEATSNDMSVDNDRRVGSRNMAEEPYVGDLILRALAGVYSDHPDYRTEWAV